MSTKAPTPWRQAIIDRLAERNRHSSTTFAELIRQNNRLYDSFNQLRHQIVKLTVQNEQLRSNISPAAEGASATSTDELAVTNAANQQRIKALEQQLVAQSAELRDLHKCRDKHTTFIELLTNDLANETGRFTSATILMESLNRENGQLLAETRMLTTSLDELKRLNANLHDETTALQLALQAQETQLRQTRAENEQLVERLLRHKAVDVSRMNDDNDEVQRKQAEQVVRELAEAMEDHVELGPRRPDEVSICACGHRRRRPTDDQ